MKKVFTHLAVALLATNAVSVNAETVTANFQTWTSAKGYEDYYKPFSLEINQAEDGSYTMPNFMNSGSDVSFTFDVPAVGKYAQISITSPTENVATDWEWGKGYEDYYALIDENGESLVFSEENTKGETKKLNYPIIVTADDGYLYAYIQALDTSKSEYKYYADFTFVAYSDDDADENGNWYYMSFYFDKEDSSDPTEPTEPTEPIGEEGVTVYIDNYDGDAVADPFETTLVANSDGSYTLNNVMSSDQPLSFKFTDSIDNWADVEITSPLDTSVTYPYLMSADGKNYLFCTVYGFDGNAGAYEFTYPYIYPEGCGVYCYDPTDANNKYKYYASFCLNAFDADAKKSVGWFYLEFLFGENGTVKVNSVNADENAPVEYYNLNGMRVENPANGIFIRKQGSNVKKVAIK